jgi:predicted P-loop ATPase
MWVNWRPLKVKGRITKIPYATNGRKASSTDEKTWATYDEVKAVSPNIGIIFSPAEKLLGIDIDHCLTDNKIEHEQKEQIAELILEADTYTEISPSGTGLHLFLIVPMGLHLDANRHAGFECYTSGRYFTVTEDPYGEARPVREVDGGEAVRLLEIIGYPWKKEEVVPTVTATAVKEDIEPRVPVKLEDDVLLTKMFASKNGSDIRALYDGDVSTYENDESKADMALCSYLAFWTGKDPVQMERLWTASTLGSREKTKERKDYRDRTIMAAIERCHDVYSVTQKSLEIKKTSNDLDLLFLMNDKKEKVYVQNTENMCRVLRKHLDFSGRFRFDDFKNVYEIKPMQIDIWRTLEDNDAVNVQTAIQILFPFFGKVGKDMVYDAIIKVSKENRIDSASDWIKSITWDKTPRLDEWLSKVYGAPVDAYHKSVGSNWLKGLVKRIIEPGCKFDYVLVLEGEQGTKKSTSLRVLGGDWHVETTMSTDTKDFFMQFQGKAIVEFSEGETLSRTEVKRMKAIITMQSDKYRPPYERTSQDFPRRCVFAMTTNQEEYLKDETGNRRWLPVTLRIAEANVEWLTNNRDQMFAEAYHRVFNLKETVYDFPKAEMIEAQSSRRIHDPNNELVSDWYFNKLSFEQRKDGITIQQVYRDAIYAGFTAKPIDRYNEMSIADVLKNHLKLEKRRKMINAVQSTRWFDPKIKEDDEDPSVFDETEKIISGIGW